MNKAMWHQENEKENTFVVSSLNTGGAQRAFANLSFELSKSYDCVFLLNDRKSIVYPYKGTVLDLGMSPQNDKTKLWYQLKILLKRFVKLRKLKKSGDYVACISALNSVNVVNVLTKNRMCKTIISVCNFASKNKLKGVKGNS